MIIPMSYWKLTDAEIIAHFDAVARATAILIARYNNPATEASTSALTRSPGCCRSPTSRWSRRAPAT